MIWGRVGGGIIYARLNVDVDAWERIWRAIAAALAQFLVQLIWIEFNEEGQLECFYYCQAGNYQPYDNEHQQQNDAEPRVEIWRDDVS